MGVLFWLGCGFSVILVLAGILWFLAGKKKNKTENDDWSAEDILKKEG